MKKLLLGLVACLFMLVNTGCSAIDSALDDYLNYCTVTIEYDYDWDSISGADYKNFKMVFGDNEYNAIGSYRVPKGTVLNLSWSYSYSKYDNYDGYVWHWATASKSVSVGTNGKTKITISGKEVDIEIESSFDSSFEFGS